MADTSLEEYERALQQCGGRREDLTQRDRGALLQEWRSVYAARLFAATGRWKHSKHEWHLFSFGYVTSLRSKRAMAEYARQAAVDLIVWPESLHLPVVRLSGSSLPDFSGTGLDVYVWPADLSWVMAFTHEDSSGYGPYFVPREWAALEDRPDSRAPLS
ncbi:MAG: hypothetical protein HY815_05030 [Candidatus Riflebacteria bacterium]|nr:hypothetical protein [Candidatus Riflebacteria bacterium]